MTTTNIHTTQPAAHCEAWQAHQLLRSPLITMSTDDLLRALPVARITPEDIQRAEKHVRDMEAECKAYLPCAASPLAGVRQAYTDRAEALCAADAALNRLRWALATQEGR